MDDIKFEKLLKCNGLKVTKHRKAVLELLEKSSQPLTAEDIYLLLKEKDISINISSIYRILDALASNLLINKFSFEENNKTLYEINNLEHKHHLICSSCKKVFPLSGCPLSNYESKIEDELDFEVTNHKLEIYGFCKDCRKQALH